MPDQIRALVLHPDDDDTEPTAVNINADVDTYQRLVGGLIEAVYGNGPDGTRAVFYVNDSGIEQNLPPNPLGTRLWRRCNPAAVHSLLLGTVIVVGASGADDDDVPAAVVTLARRVYRDFGAALLTAIRANRRR